MCKKLTFLVSFALVLSFFLSSVTKGADPNLVGWWKLNEVDGLIAYDSSGNNNNGAVQGNPQWVSGKINGALQFDGAGDWVNCGTPTLFVIQREITMACWIKVATFTKTWEAFFTKGDGAYRISRAQSGGKTHMGLNGTTLGWFDGTVNVQDNQWHHVAGVYNGSEARIYIDGILDTAKPNTGLISPEASVPLYIAANYHQATRQLTGLIDDVRLYNRALKPVEIPVIMYGEKYPFAYDPEPADGATVPTTVITLKWKPGESVASVNGHRVYLDLNEQKVKTRSGCQINGVSTTDPCYPVPTPLTVGTTYYWAVDEVNDPNIWKGVGGDQTKTWRFTISPKIASNPVPSNGAELVIPPVTLEWIAGAGATQHHVYFGTNWSNVNNGTGGTDKGTRTEPNFVPGSLELGKTYYWRIDESNGVTTYKGDVWNFTTIGPRVGVRGDYYNNIDLSGQPVLGRTDYNIDFDWGITSPDPLVNADNFSVRWTAELEVPFTETYTFSIYCLAEDGVRLWVNGEQIINNWPASNPEGFEGTINLVAGMASFKMEFYESAWGAVAKLSWQSPSIPRQIIPIGAFSLPITALNPSPFDGATDVERTPALRWSPGMYAATHDVYFGTDFNSVSDANRAAHPGLLYYSENQVPNSYNVGPLEFDTTYYWRIDEVNDANIWKGDVWSFTTGRYLVVDDFEGYNNTSNKIQNTWIKDGGGTAGYPDPNYAELTIVHGGAQSMPFDYNNTKSPYDSNATRTFATDQNWVAYKADPNHIYPLKSLSLWFRGYPASVGSFVENPAGTYMMTASGADINTPDVRHLPKVRDDFHYAYIQVNYECDIIAKVDSISNSDSQAKAGLMIRDSLADNSAYAMMCVTPSSGIWYQYRPTAGQLQDSGRITRSGLTAPHWLWLRREFNGTDYEWSGYYSADGSNWTSLVSDGNIPLMAHSSVDKVYIGLIATARNASATFRAAFSNVSITDGGMGTMYNNWPTRANPVTLPSPWTSHQDIGIKSNNAAPLYVTLQDSTNAKKTVTHPDPNVVLSTSWQAWNIALSDFTGVNLAAIKKITLGVGSNSTPVGTLYFDDIRVYLRRCIPGLRAPDFTGSDCLVDYQDLAILTDNWLISNYQVTPTAPSDANLVAYYRFEGNFNDSSINGNNGEPNGATIVTDPIRGQVASFDGMNDYVTTNKTLLDNLSAFTLAGWVIAGNPQDSRTGLFGQNDAIEFGFDGGINIWTSGGGSTSTTWTLGTTTWHHVAVVGDGKGVKLYIDGVQLASGGSATSNYGTSTYPVNIGGGGVWDTSGNWFAGRMDDVRIYSRALSPGEIAYLAGKTTPFTQPLSGLLIPQNSAINLYNDGRIDLKDYAIFANTWLEVLLWP